MRRGVLWVAVVLASAAWADVAGRVVDEAGQPVAGARLTVFRAGLTPTVVARGVADQNGAFALAPPEEPGTWWLHTVVAEAPGRAAAWRSAGLGTRSALLTLGPAATLRVTVLDERRQPIPRCPIRVTAIRRSVGANAIELFQPPAGAVEAWRAVTDDAGVARLGGLPPGVTVELGPDDPRFAQPPRGPGWPLGDGETAGAPLVLAPGASISGRVTDADGQPVAGAMLLWSEQADEPPPTTGPDGRYRLDHLRAGNGTLAVLPDPTRREVWCAPAQPLGLDAGEELSRIDFVLVRGVPLTVRVETADGTPLPGSGAVVTGPQQPFQPSSLWSDLLAMADAKGEARLAVLPGRQRVRLVLSTGAAGGGRQPDEVTLDAVAGQPATALLRYGPAPVRTALRVRVVDAAGRPVANALVIATRTDGGARLSHMANTGGDGACTLQLTGPDGVTLQAGVGHRRSAPLVGKPGDEVTLTLLDEPPSRVEVTVEDSQGKPLPGVTVSLSNTQGFAGNPVAASTDAEGHATLTDCPSGPGYAVLARADGYTSAISPGFALTAGQTHTVAPLRLTRADQTVAGWVLDAEGKPVAGARVTTRDTGGTGRSAVSSATGEFRVNGLTAGKVTVQVIDERGRRLGEVTTDAGDENVVLRLKPPADKR